MKRIIFVLAILTVAVSIIFYHYKIRPELSRPQVMAKAKIVPPVPPIKKEVIELAPDFTLKDLSGRNISLSNFEGKVIILDFWASWCPPCREEIPHFIELYNQYKEKGLEIVGVALDAKGIDVVQPFSEGMGINYTVLIGNRAVTDLYGGIFSIPTTYVIDREGGIRKKYIGYRDKEVFEVDIKELI